jgi:hypothetical protein
MKARLIIGGALVLALFALPVLADLAGQAPDLRAAIFAAPAAACALPMASKTGGPGGIGAASVCTAHCWDGSTRTCTGTSCTADDSSCPSQRGNCWSNAEGTKYCPQCSSPTCDASTTCINGSSVYCQGTSGDCFSYYQCYAYCDGNYHLCSGPLPQVCPP